MVLFGNKLYDLLGIFTSLESIKVYACSLDRARTPKLWCKD